MVITRKSRPELESDIRRVKSEIASLERQLQARETQSRFDDDLDDEEELEEILYVYAYIIDYFNVFVAKS